MAKANKAEAHAEPPEAEGQGAAAAEQSFRSKKLIIMVAAGVLVLGGGGGASWFFLFSKHEDPEEKPAVAAVKPPAFLDMPEMVVSRSSTNNGRAQYLKARIVLEVTDQKVVDEI